jgi:hypothetical protein
MQRLDRKAFAIGVLVIGIVIGGCSSTPMTTPPAVTSKNPQVYLAPLVAGTTVGPDAINTPQTYTIDDAGTAFSQSTYVLGQDQEGAQVVAAGSFTASSRNLLTLALSATYIFDSNAAKWTATNYNPAVPGGFAVELPGQAGALMQLKGQPAVPLVPLTTCPTIATAQTYQFITIPAALITPTAPGQAATWDPITDTAYGSVQITTNGSNVNLASIRQYTLPSMGGKGTPASPADSSIAGVCGQTAYGNAISIPGQIDISEPGPGGSHPPQAIFNVTPGGFLVEDNGDSYPYQNSLGAGTGAVGLLMPSAALDTNAAVNAQYQGFIYGAGAFPGNGSSATGWSSHLASFGFSSVPSICSSVAASASTLIYGVGGDDPSASSNGSCNLAIDLGPQDAANHGLYPNAKVWMGAAYPENKTNAPYSFSAVAIAGQLQGKYAIFLLGVDSKQPWAIYLLQSN